MIKSRLYTCLSGISILLTTTLVTPLGYAEQTARFEKVGYAAEADYSPEFSAFIGGVELPNALSGQTLQLPPYEVAPYADTFTNQNGSSAFTWGVALGYRLKFNHHLLSGDKYLLDAIRMDVDFFQLSHMTQTGDVLQFGSSEFDNYSYNLGLRNLRIMTDFAFDFHPLGRFVIPFIEAGVGAGMTEISYSSTPIEPVPGSGLSLDDQTDWNFAYQVGGGLKCLFWPHLEASVRYLYANMGSVNSSTVGDPTSLSEPLKVDMSSHSYLFGLTYLLG